MDNLTLSVPHQNTCTGFEDGRELIEEVEEHYLLERDVQQLGNGVNLGHIVLILELVFGVPLHAIVKAFGNGQQL